LVKNGLINLLGDEEEDRTGVRWKSEGKEKVKTNMWR